MWNKLNSNPQTTKVTAMAGALYTSLTQRKPAVKHWCICLFMFLLVTVGTIGIYMLCIIKSPLNMASVQEYAHSDSNEYLTGHYPNILHQIWLDYMTMPQMWIDSRKYNIKMNPNMTHMLWTSKEIEPFFAKEYPWFLDTYLSYPYFNQKVNAARYFIIYHYGGVYMDMDFIVNVSFSEIYKKHDIKDYECVFPTTWPSGISTALYACKKHSRFMKFLTSNLQTSNRWLVVPYCTTMWSTGPRYLSKCYDSYPGKDRLIYILSYHYYTEVYFTHLHGSTWHRWDAQLVKTVYRVISSKLFLFLLVLISSIWVYIWYIKPRIHLLKLYLK